MPSTPAPSGHPLTVPVGPMPVLFPPSAHYKGHPVIAHLFNPSAKPMQIHAEALLLRGGCAQYLSKDLHITPTDFTIPAHKTKNITITVTNGAHGDFGALFVMEAKSNGHNITVNRAVGEQVFAGTDAHSCVVHHKPLAAPVLHHDGFPVLPLLGLIGALMLLLGALAAMVVVSSTRRKRRQIPNPDKWIW